MTADTGTRDAFKAWLAANDITPHRAAKLAGVSPGTIYNFLSGVSDSLSSGVLRKLADATDTTVDAILTGIAGPKTVPVTHRIGALGRMFSVADDDRVSLKIPPGVSEHSDLCAAIVEGEGLHPIPNGWAVFFVAQETSPETIIGELAVVRYAGGGDRPVVRTIRRGPERGLFNLQAFNGTLIEAVEIIAAHKVVSFSAV